VAQAEVYLVDSKKVRPADPRLDERSNVFLAATLQSASQSFTVRIRNISPMGALLEGPDLPGERQRARLRRGSLAVDGEVAWENGELRGIRFDGPVDVGAWVPRAHNVRTRALRRARTSASDQEVGEADAHAPSQESSVEQLAAELLEICERILLQELTFETGDDVRRARSIALSLKKAGR